MCFRSDFHISNTKSMTTSDESPEKANKESSNGAQLDQICNECHQKFDSELDLVFHVNISHKEVQSFVCHECQQIFDSKDVFSGHLMTHQTDREESRSTVTPKSRPRTITGLLSNFL